MSLFDILVLLITSITTKPVDSYKQGMRMVGCMQTLSLLVLLITFKKSPQDFGSLVMV